jgi:hypothetical protein
MAIQFSMVVPCWAWTLDGINTSVLQITLVKIVTFSFSEKINFKNHSSCLQNGHPLLNGAPCRSRTLDCFNTSLLQVTRISTELSISGAKV